MHSACVTRQVGHCEAELHAAAEAESARSQAEGLYNRNLVVQALTLKQRCGASQLQSLQSLQSLPEPAAEPAEHQQKKKKVIEMHLAAGLS